MDAVALSKFGILGYEGMHGRFSHDVRSHSSKSLAFIGGIYLQAYFWIIVQLLNSDDAFSNSFLLVAGVSYAISIYAAVRVYRAYPKLMLNVIIPKSYPLLGHFLMLVFMAGGVFLYIFSLMRWSDF